MRVPINFLADGAKELRPWLLAGAMRRLPQKLWFEVFTSESSPDQVWLSGEFMAQIYAPVDGGQRVTICTLVGAEIDIETQSVHWASGIAWDDLMRVKKQIGFGSAWAVEIYPPEREVVNVANLRHLWVCDKPSFAWTNASAGSD